MVGINHVTGEWWCIPGTRGLKRGCPMKDGKIENKNKFQFCLKPSCMTDLSEMLVHKS